MKHSLLLLSILLIGCTPAPSTPPEQGGSSSVPVATGCKVTGCSGQLCIDASEEDMVTDCMWREEYACYRTAKCERQPEGDCNWTKTQELSTCLDQAAISPIDSSMPQ